MALYGGLKQLESDYSAGTISKSEYTKRKKSLQAQIVQYESRMDRDMAQINGYHNVTENASTTVNTYANVQANHQNSRSGGQFSSEKIPSENFCRNLLLSKIANESNGLFRVVSFSKTNGYLESSYYIVDSSLSFIATSNCTWINAPDRNFGGGDSFKASPYVNQSANHQMLNFATDRRAMVASQRVNVNVKFTFRQTERGWQLVSLSIN